MALPLPADLRLSPEQFAVVRAAMRSSRAAYRVNGASLGWLLFPEERAVGGVGWCRGDPQDRSA